MNKDMVESPSRSEPVIDLSWEGTGDVNRLLSREWLVTNGLGGYSSSTVMQVATRRYHGIFVPDLPSPRGRTMVIPRLDEELQIGTTTVRLSGAEYTDERLDTDIVRHLTSFCREWQTPTWRFVCEGREVVKRIIMPYGQNTVYVEYRLHAGEPVTLRLRPFITFRMPDAPLSEARKSPFPMSHGQGPL